MRKKHPQDPTLEVYGCNQKQLELVTHNEIKRLNAAIKRCNVRLENWENETDERIKRYTKAEYREEFLKPLIERRKDYIYKLRDIRNGVIAE